MRRVLLVMAIAGLGFGAQVTPVSANVDDLSQGVIIAHYPPDFTYSAGMDWCGEYDNVYSIASCGEQNNRIDGGSTPDNRVVWYIVSGFEEDKQWAGTSFGLGEYTSTLFYFTAYGPCLADGLETSTGSWPGPNQGTTVVATTSNWEGNFQVVYHFEGYTYTSGVLPIGVDPAQGVAGHGTVPPPYPSQFYDAICLGAMGFDTDGVYCCADDPGTTAACCTGGVCTVETEEDCLAGGGTWYSAEATCDAPFECPIEGACCWNQQSCTIRTLEDCDAIGGNWHEGFTCPGGGGDEYDCTIEGDIQPCCDLITEVCTMNYEQDCVQGGGDFFESWHSCELTDPENPTGEGPCAVMPTGGETWGSIKTIYR